MTAMGPLAYINLGIEELNPLLEGETQVWTDYRASLPPQISIVIKGVDFDSRLFTCLDLTFVKFQNCSFKDCLILDSNLDGSRFVDCYFYRTDISKCSLVESSIRKCFFQECDITNSILTNIEISDSNPRLPI